MQAGYAEESHLGQLDHERVYGGRQTRPPRFLQVLDGGGIDVTVHGDQRGPDAAGRPVPATAAFTLLPNQQGLGPCPTWAGR